MLLRDAADVPDVHDLPLVPYHAHRDGVLAHLGGDVAVHLNPQVLQHQKPCASQQKARSLGLLASILVFAGGSLVGWTRGPATALSPTLPRKLQEDLGRSPPGSYFMPTLLYLEGRQDQTRGDFWNRREQQVTFWVAFVVPTSCIHCSFLTPHQLWPPAVIPPILQDSTQMPPALKNVSSPPLPHTLQAPGSNPPPLETPSTLYSSPTHQNGGYFYFSPSLGWQMLFRQRRSSSVFSS